MPEGDTLVRTADGLRPYLLGRRVTAASARVPGPQAERLVGATVTGVEAHGQEPADPVRQRPRGPDAPADARLVAPLPPGRALASAAGPGPARDRGPGERRRLLRCPDGRAVRAAGRGRCIPRCRSLGPDLLREPVDIGEVLRRLRDPARADLPDRGRAAGPAGAGRHRQRGQERGPVAGRPLAVHAGARRWTTPRSASSSTWRARSSARAPRPAAAPATSTAAPAGPAPAAARSSAWSTRARTCRASRSGARAASPTRGAPHDRHGPGRRHLRARAGRLDLPGDGRRRRRPPRRTRSRCTAADLARLAPGDTDPSDLVARSFAFLLAREPKTSILRRFDLPVIARYFPEYEREIRLDA